MRIQIRAIAWVAAATIPLLAGNTLGARALDQQTTADTGLNSRVTLALGATTVGQVMLALTKQTGVQIDAAPYLKYHKLTVQMENISAKEALDAVATLNDWTWSKRDDGSVLLSRPTAVPVRKASDAGKALRAALPREFRVYLGIDPPLGNATGWKPNLMRVSYAGNLAQRAQQNLVTTIKDQLDRSVDIPYESLTEEQKEDLAVSLVFRIFRGMTDADLWADQRGFHRMNIDDVYLQLDQGEILMISARDSSGPFPAFGQNIMRGPGALRLPYPPR